MLVVRNSHEIHIHHPFAPACPGLALAQYHYIRLAVIRNLRFQHLGDVNLRTWIETLEFTQHTEQMLARQDAIHHQFDAAAFSVAHSAGGAFQRVERFQKRPDLRQKLLACRRQHGAPSFCFQQGDFKAFLQHGEVIAHRRLAAMCRLSRAGETAAQHYLI